MTEKKYTGGFKKPSQATSCVEQSGGGVWQDVKLNPPETQKKGGGESDLRNWASERVGHVSCQNGGWGSVQSKSKQPDVAQRGSGLMKEQDGRNRRVVDVHLVGENVKRYLKRLVRQSQRKKVVKRACLDKRRGGVK